MKWIDNDASLNSCCYYFETNRIVLVKYTRYKWKIHDNGGTQFARSLIVAYNSIQNFDSKSPALDDKSCELAIRNNYRIIYNPHRIFKIYIPFIISRRHRHHGRSFNKRNEIDPVNVVELKTQHKMRHYLLSKLIYSEQKKYIYNNQKICTNYLYLYSKQKQ